ncbi:MAG: cell division protein SepF [Thermoleophilia bacterium]|nr:cell division protein SepF [Thermoleophilia bacterium]MCZ4495776.1 cell division protein SepF [Thermoleophilia bacterium]
MGARDYWDRMLVYFGIAEEAAEGDEEWQDERTGGAARRGAAARPERNEYEEGPASARRPAARPRPSAAAAARPSTPRPSQSVAGVGVVPPRSFNDAQQIADQFKGGHPVIVNLQAADSELSKRLIDFASGLTYGLDGRMQRIADKVFLLTPPDVDVSADDRAEIAESGFFNQS